MTDTVIYVIEDNRVIVTLDIASTTQLFVMDQVATPMKFGISLLELESIDVLAPDPANYNMVALNNQSQNLLISDPVNTGDRILIRIKDDGVARAITFGPKYRGMTSGLPATTVIGKTLYMGFMYNQPIDKWDLLAFVQET